jgi:hypothetical protein
MNGPAKSTWTLSQGADGGVVRMKAVARSYVWLPGIDSQIEQTVKCCDGCQLTQKMPQVAPLHPWEWPSAPWATTRNYELRPSYGLLPDVLHEANLEYGNATLRARLHEFPK